MSTEIDCEFTDDLICPYCGYAHEDDGEMNEPGQMECSSCDKHFSYDVDYTKYFSSKQVPCLNGEPHAWKVETYPSFPNYRRCTQCDLRDPKGIK
jgi:hypothetical protein